MKTSNFQHPVFAYIMNAIDMKYINQDAPEKMKDSYTENELLQAVFDDFNVCVWQHQKAYYKNNIQAAFSSWIQGLPNSFNIAYWNSEILQLSREWGFLQEKKTEAAQEKENDKYIIGWFSFITTKFFQLCRKHKVNIEG